MKAPTKQKQLALFSSSSLLGSLEHGGALNVGKRKKARPFSPNAPIHVVLKSRLAQGPWSLLDPRNRSQVNALVVKQASLAGVRIYRYVNVGSHIHLLIRAFTQEGYRKFLRAVCGLIARHVMGVPSSPSSSPASSAQQQQQQQSGRRFWESIPYTRLVHWGREFRALCAYLAKNTLEACGFSGARLRFTPQGEAVIVVGAPEFRPGRGMDWEQCLSAVPKQEKPKSQNTSPPLPHPHPIPQPSLMARHQPVRSWRRRKSGKINPDGR